MGIVSKKIVCTQKEGFKFKNRKKINTCSKQKLMYSFNF